MRTKKQFILSIAFILLSFPVLFAQNIALNKPTSQSSTFVYQGTPYLSDRATDGNNSTSNHTAINATPHWLRVDLGAIYTIDRIVIRNRTSFSSRLDGAIVLVGTVESSNPNDYTDISFNLNGELVQEKNGLSDQGRYVMVYLATGISLNLAEVEVYGTEGSAGGSSGGGGTTGGGTTGGGVWSESGSNIYFDGGNVGIGTSSPGSRLFIRDGTSGGTAHSYSDLTIESNNHSMVSILTPNNRLGYFGFADNADDYVGGMQYNHITNMMIFRVNNHNSDMAIDRNGNVGIGTGSNNLESKLAVKGSIHAEEVKVDLDVPGPDYVFKEDYDLKSLEEVQNYIKKNGHLPNIPSAATMEENGIQLGEMNMKLLEKIEELTLYIIDQQKVMNNQQKMMKSQEKRIQKLEKN